MSAGDGAHRWEGELSLGIPQGTRTEITRDGALFHPFCNLKLPLKLTDPGAHLFPLSFSIYPYFFHPSKFTSVLLSDHFQPM